MVGSIIHSKCHITRSLMFNHVTYFYQSLSIPIGKKGLIMIIIFLVLILTSSSEGSNDKETLFQKISIPWKTWKNMSLRYKHDLDTIQDCGMFCSLPYLEFNAFKFIKNQKVCIVGNVSYYSVYLNIKEK